MNGAHGSVGFFRGGGLRGGGVLRRKMDMVDWDYFVTELGVVQFLSTLTILLMMMFPFGSYPIPSMLFPFF